MEYLYSLFLLQKQRNCYQAIFRCHHSQQSEGNVTAEVPIADKRLGSKGATSYSQNRRISQDTLTSAALRTDLEKDKYGVL